MWKLKVHHFGWHMHDLWVTAVEILFFDEKMLVDELLTFFLVLVLCYSICESVLLIANDVGWRNVFGFLIKIMYLHRFHSNCNSRLTPWFSLQRPLSFRDGMNSILMAHLYFTEMVVWHHHIDSSTLPKKSLWLLLIHVVLCRNIE